MLMYIQEFSNFYFDVKFLKYDISTSAALDIMKQIPLYIHLLLLLFSVSMVIFLTQLLS